MIEGRPGGGQIYFADSTAKGVRFQSALTNLNRVIGAICFSMSAVSRSGPELRESDNNSTFLGQKATALAQEINQTDLVRKNHG
jgi:hypothetical protein